MSNLDETQGKNSKSPKNVQVLNTKGRFLQTDSCLTLHSNIRKCIDCHSQINKKVSNLYNYDKRSCRFYAFRLLKQDKSGELYAVGFLDPFESVNDEDFDVWLPKKYSLTPSRLCVETSITILKNTGDQFCKIVHDENKVLHEKSNMRKRKKIKRKLFWKKNVNGVRELCDVCKTSIFNYHWVCGNCGFIVCLDCYRTELYDSPSTTHSLPHAKKVWIRCNNQKNHKLNKLLLTQILPGETLNCISKIMHSVCIDNNIPINCNSLFSKSNKCSACFYIDQTTDSFQYVTHPIDNVEEKGQPSARYVSLIDNKDAECILSNNKTQENEIENIKNIGNSPSEQIKDQKHDQGHNQLFPIGLENSFASKLSLRSDNKTNVPYMYLCDGYVLRLLDPNNDDNYELFQKHWKLGQPVIVSNVANNLNPKLWCPESFSKDFGNQKTDIINFSTNDVYTNCPMHTFWKGFHNAADRLCDEHGNPLLLKLKDWPQAEDFSKILPDRFQDLMDSLPLKEYTHHNGRYNLVSYLPHCFIRPDLGPKMYSAYGNSGTQLEKVGTTNIHLDMSDAVNVMVHVSITKNCKKYDQEWYIQQALETIKESGCDDLTMERINLHKEIPGALWHIYHPSDTSAIRDLIKKVDVENGKPLCYFSDPIHDQSHYLNHNLRERLFNEYGVKGYTIIQFYGDAVFTPAGAPHQVRNLHNCIKVAEDFVSPENANHSLVMTKEFRNLSDDHTIHEDKLQMKNIIFHAIKDTIDVLKRNQLNL